MKSIILYDFELQNLLKNGKGQIRRVCKVQPPGDHYKLGRETNGKYEGKMFWYDDDFCCSEHFICPFGAVGQEIWVKETWGIWQRGDSTPGGQPYDPSYIYKSTDDEPEIPELAIIEPFRWKSPIAMPREASRMTIIPERIWVEKVQDITEDGAIVEGAEPYHHGTMGMMSAAYAFGRLWGQHAKQGYKWADNPMVFAAEVRVK